MLCLCGVCLGVLGYVLVVIVRPAKYTDEPAEMSFGMNSGMDPRIHVLDESMDAIRGIRLDDRGGSADCRKAPKSTGAVYSEHPRSILVDTPDMPDFLVTC